jgi:hypothetical protein
VSKLQRSQIRKTDARRADSGDEVEDLAPRLAIKEHIPTSEEVRGYFERYRTAALEVAHAWPTTPAAEPSFGQPSTLDDPLVFGIPHGSDIEAFRRLDCGLIPMKPTPVPIASHSEPVLRLSEVFGRQGPSIHGEHRTFG